MNLKPFSDLDWTQIKEFDGRVWWWGVGHDDDPKQIVVYHKEPNTGDISLYLVPPSLMFIIERCTQSAADTARRQESIRWQYHIRAAMA